MLEVALHAGTEHPSLLWIIVPSILTFLAGLSIGRYADRIAGWIRPSDDSTDAMT